MNWILLLLFCQIGHTFPSAISILFCHHIGSRIEQNSGKEQISIWFTYSQSMLLQESHNTICFPIFFPILPIHLSLSHLCLCPCSYLCLVFLRQQRMSMCLLGHQQLCLSLFGLYKYGQVVCKPSLLYFLAQDPIYAGNRIREVTKAHTAPCTWLLRVFILLTGHRQLITILTASRHINVSLKYTHLQFHYSSSSCPFPPHSTLSCPSDETSDN